MKAVISTTADDQYQFFLPITTWAWNKLGVEVLCLVSEQQQSRENSDKEELISDTMRANNAEIDTFWFRVPKHKEATYTQVSRIFAASVNGLSANEHLVTSDIDMLVFRKDFIKQPVTDFFDVYGTDLVPDGQHPMCYVSGLVDTWQRFFTKGRKLQECLDDELAHEEMENMRGNLWARDQELLKKYIGKLFLGHTRTNGQTPFAQNRIDRDDSFFMERLNHDVIDYHCHRPGYLTENFEKILSVISYFYPNEDLTWMEEYQKQYKALL